MRISIIVPMYYGQKYVKQMINQVDQCAKEADPGTYEEIFHYATQFLFFLGCPLYILYLHHTFRSILQGMGDVMTPIFSGLMQFAFRVSSAFIISSLVGPVGIFAAEPFAWTGSVIYLSLRLIYRIRHNQITS